MRHNRAHGQEGQGSKTETARPRPRPHRSPTCSGCRPGRWTWRRWTRRRPRASAGARPTRPRRPRRWPPSSATCRSGCTPSAGWADDPAKRILMVLQGMDTSGKGGVIRHAIGMVDPQGVRIKAFKAPTEEERAHALPVADRAGGAAAGHHRHLRPLAVRGRADRPGERSWSRRRSGASATTRSTRSRSGWPPTARCSSSASCTSPSDEQKARLAGPAGRPDQALEVQPRRRRRARQVAGLPGGVRRGPGAVQHPARAVVRHPVGPQVVPQLGRGPAAARAPAGARPASGRSPTSTSRPRRRGSLAAELSAARWHQGHSMHRRRGARDAGGSGADHREVPHGRCLLEVVAGSSTSTRSIAATT